MTKLPSDKIPIIYILSNGRSGSTLLDLLLGLQPEIWTLGEAHVLPWSLRENLLPCGCSLPVGKCEFWSLALPQIPIGIGNYPIEYFRESHVGGKAIRGNHLYNILRRKPAKQWALAIDEYGKLNAEYFEAVKNAAERRTEQPIRWLVDASKNMYRLFWLQQSGYFDLRVIHLMKDPRAFVYSMVKNLLPDAKNKSIRFSGRWLVENWFYSYLCNDPALAGQTFCLRYEQLATQPGETMTALGNWLNVDINFDINDDTFRRYENHAIAGNPMRWQSSGIKLDEKWRLALPPSYARIIWVLTWFLARSYGYQ